MQHPQLIRTGLFLQMMAQQGDLIPYSNIYVTPFHSHQIPDINILLYFAVVSNNAGLDDSQTPSILILIERLCLTAAKNG